MPRGSKVFVGLCPVSAGNKHQERELRQAGIQGINLLSALFLYQLHYTSQRVASNAECLQAWGRGGD